MKNSVANSGKNKQKKTKESPKPVKNVTDEDIRKRAFEIYKQNGVTHHSDLEDWYRAERELRGTDL